MTEDADSERIVREHCREPEVGTEFSFDRLDLDLDRWTFFQVFPQVLDADPTTAVVREDGTVVAEDFAAELGEICRSLAILDADQPPVDTLVRAAGALISSDVTPIRSPEFERQLSQMYSFDDFHLPRLERQETGPVLTFLAERRGRRSILYRYEIRLSPEYEIGWERSELDSVKAPECDRPTTKLVAAGEKLGASVVTATEKAPPVWNEADNLASDTRVRVPSCERLLPDCVAAPRCSRTVLSGVVA